MDSLITKLPEDVKSNGNGVKTELLNSTAPIAGDIAAPPRNPRQYKSSRRHFQNGRRRAAVRAHLAARRCMTGFFKNIAVAAEACGSNRRHVEALIALLKAENAVMLDRVLAGEMPVLAAATEVKRLAKLIAAFRSASASDRVAFAKTIGPTSLFDHTLVPAL